MAVDEIFLQLWEYFQVTLKIFGLTLLFSLPLGLFVYFGRASKIAPFFFLKKYAKSGYSGENRFRLFLSKVKSVLFSLLASFKPISLIFKFLISVLRGTPLMLQLIVVCYGPYYLFGAKLSPEWSFTALIIGFVINYAAYFAEIYRGGIESIPIGQYEAAKVLGYNRVQTFVKIILPQMIKRVIPATTNEIITLVKDTSLAFVLSYVEMFTRAKQLANSISNLFPLMIAGLFYFVFNFIIAWVMGQVEKKLNYYR